MPIGVIINALVVVIGGIVGALAGDKISESFKENLNTVFGACAMAMGISSVVLMENMPAVVFSVIVGTSIGLAMHLGQRIDRAGLMMQKGIGRVLSGLQRAGKEQQELTGNGKHKVMWAKRIRRTAQVQWAKQIQQAQQTAVPQFLIFMALYLLAGMIYPLCTPAMINDFKASGGILLLATGFRMIKVKEFPVADMIPAMALAMPVSYLWTNYIMPLMG